MLRGFGKPLKNSPKPMTAHLDQRAVAIESGSGVQPTANKAPSTEPRSAFKVHAHRSGCGSARMPNQRGR